MAVDGTVLTGDARKAAGQIVEVLRDLRKNRHDAAQTERKERLGTLAGQHKEASARAAALDGALEEAGKKQRELSGLQDDADAKIAKMEARLASGEGMTSRDLLALQGDIDAAKGKRDTLEEQELEVLEQIEALEAEAASAQDAATGVAEQGRKLQGERKETAERLAAQAAELQAREADALDRLPDDVAGAIRGDLAAGGTGLALIGAGACGSCGEAFSGARLAEMNAAEPGTVFVCESCEVPLLKA